MDRARQGLQRLILEWEGAERQSTSLGAEQTYCDEIEGFVNACKLPHTVLDKAKQYLDKIDARNLMDIFNEDLTVDYSESLLNHLNLKEFEKRRAKAKLD